jgi:nitrogen-specific signal transduction histidine kinase
MNESDLLAECERLRADVERLTAERDEARANGFRAGIERAAERVDTLSGNPSASSEQTALLRDLAESLRKLEPGGRVR